MEKIKISLKRTLPAILIVTAVIMVINLSADYAERLIFSNDNAASYEVVIDTGVYKVVNFNANENVSNIISFILSVIKSVFYVGFYRYCFSLIDGEKRPAGSIFDFYKSTSGIFKSIITYHINLLIMLLAFQLSLYAAMFSIFASRDENTFAAACATAIVFLAFAVSELFWLAPYAYAKSPDDGTFSAIKRSVRLGIKYFIIILVIHIVEYMLLRGYIMFFFRGADRYDFFSVIYYGDKFPGFIFTFIRNAISLWLNITAAYIFLNREPQNVPESVSADEAIVIDDTEDEPFIKPYDFYIEADNRYNDEKTFTVENVRGFDILKVLDEMDLAYDVINYFGVRKKLKRLFDDLAFDISEYVTYEGGRTVENVAYDEIDDVKLEISVYISKQSDSSPFVVSVKIQG